MTQPALYDEDYYRTNRGGENDQASGQLFRKFATMSLGICPAGGAVLDLGCGTGNLLEELAKQGIRDLHGLDFSDAAIKLARERLSPVLGAEVETRLRCGSAADASIFEPESFDFIAMTDVVEHLPPEILEAALANVKRWLRPSGKLLVHTFPTAGLHALYRRWLTLRGQRAQLEQTDQLHCNVQTRARLSASLERSGLTLERMWLENDAMLMSSTYYRMKPGLTKNATRIGLTGLGVPAVQAVMGKLGLSEFVAPSIYCIAVRAR